MLLHVEDDDNGDNYVDEFVVDNNDVDSDSNGIGNGGDSFDYLCIVMVITVLKCRMIILRLTVIAITMWIVWLYLLLRCGVYDCLCDVGGFAIHTRDVRSVSLSSNTSSSSLLASISDFSLFRSLAGSLRARFLSAEQDARGES